MNNVTVMVGKNEQSEISISYFEPEGDRWCSVYITSPSGELILRLESHASSLHLLNELCLRLKEASRYLRGPRESGTRYINYVKA